MDVVQTVLIVLTMAGLFLDRLIIALKNSIIKATNVVYYTSPPGYTHHTLPHTLEQDQLHENQPGCMLNADSWALP